MLNQVAVEALYSATYLENYLDSVENLPNDLQRHISRMRQLDVDFQAILQDIEQYKEVLQRGPEASETSNNGDSTEEKPGASSTAAAVGGAGHWRKRLLQKVQTALIESLEIGDEKLQLVQSMQDAVEIKSRQLETDCQALGDKKFNKDREGNENLKESSNNREVGGGAGGSSSGGNAGSGGERQSKRARRTRPDNDRDSPVPPTPISTSAGISSQQRKASNVSASSANAAAGGKKKKRRSGRAANDREKERSASPQEIPIDPDEPTYCLCDQVSFGEMIGCDNDLCPIEWFHFSCVQLITKPKGKWYCPRCRGDRPTVMKPKAQFLKELEKYNKEKEEKA